MYRISRSILLVASWTCLTLHQYLVGKLSTAVASASEVRDYCQSDYFNVTCGRNDVILMEKAQYGRMRPGRCVSAGYGVLGCAVDVLTFFDRRCSGRKHCTIYIGDPALHKLEPCSKDFTTYLEAQYTCLNTAAGTLATCQKDGHTLLVPSHDANKPGFISSASATEQGGLGTSVCPWRIQVGEGQTIRLSLLSFGGKRAVDEDDTVGSSVGGGAAYPPQEVCYEIGEIRETGGRRTTLSMCGGNNRETIVYSSVGNDVTVQLLSAEVLRGLAPFVVKYEVVGCRKLPNPPGGHVRIDGNTATVRCNGSRETWYLTCSGNRWVGVNGNCTNRGVAGQSEGQSSAAEISDTFPYGILIVVAIGVALGVLIGGILLSVVAYYMKRRGSMRRYVNDDVIKQAAGSTDDDDVYNQETMTSANASAANSAGGRLLVSHYNMTPAQQYPLLQGTTVYMPHHHYHHHLHHQHPLTGQSTQQWLTETTAIDDDANDDTNDDGTVGGSVSTAGTGGEKLSTFCPAGRQIPGVHPLISTADSGSTTTKSGSVRVTTGGYGQYFYESPRLNNN